MGRPIVVQSPSPKGNYGVVFEDRGDTGYFCGPEYSRGENSIVDAMHIYDVDDVPDGQRTGIVEVTWSSDGLKAALLINNYTRAVFDFAAHRGYCRKNFPESKTGPSSIIAGATAPSSSSNDMTRPRFGIYHGRAYSLWPRRTNRIV